MRGAPLVGVRPQQGSNLGKEIHHPGEKVLYGFRVHRAIGIVTMTIIIIGIITSIIIIYIPLWLLELRMKVLEK